MIQDSNESFSSDSGSSISGTTENISAKKNMRTKKFDYKIVNSIILKNALIQQDDAPATNKVEDEMTEDNELNVFSTDFLSDSDTFLPDSNELDSEVMEQDENIMSMKEH